MDSPADIFHAHRPMLLRVAYRMLGSMSEAEDVVQDAWLRWDRAERSTIRSAPAFLRRIVTRLCLDELKSARARREEYSGPWLPEPVAGEAEEEDDVTLPLLLALERLSPLERAAFLLHDVFGESFERIALTLDRSPASCRQLASRARRHIRQPRPRFPLPRDKGQEIASAFFAATREGETHRLATLLARDVTLYADGGGKRPAIARVLRGSGEVTRALVALARLHRPGSTRILRHTLINGLPGLITREMDSEIQTTALLVEEGMIRAIYIMRNPDKLQGVKSTLG